MGILSLLLVRVGLRKRLRKVGLGLLVDYSSVNQLADAVVSILQDEKKSQGMGLEARKRILKDFTWEAVANRVNLAYDEVLGQN